ncbi:neprosin family prolyl endopeptidase [Thalassomonas sp. RHCl1]|uniref:neprosin family prolyl endopeptidase n=1 Tax=Thalassomonas sp. RHCl1 TaxID=2995320 RepID=UPI00248C4878|nr:neprosin family prolyl endopeptidase [Thalassomonas sp. RHCl1]
MKNVTKISSLAIISALTLSISAASSHAVEYYSDQSQDVELVNELNTLAKANSNIRVKDVAAYKEMKRYLEKRNSQIAEKHIKKRYKDFDGADIHCIDIEHQPALKRKGMENHQIQYRPPVVTDSHQVVYDEKYSEDKEAHLDKQTVQATTTSQCDQGTIPLRRLSIKQLTRFKTLNDFMKKKADHLTAPLTDGPTDLHQYAVAGKTADNLGIISSMSAFNPYVEQSSEFSLTQIWAVGGSGDNRETVEAGIQKYRDLYGDDWPRIFIYFTPDNYGSGGCYNLSCSGFVQTNNSITIGSRLSTYNQIDGDQVEMTMSLIREQTLGHWWLQVNGTYLGYWPNNLFDASGIGEKAERTSAGGEIIHKHTSRHTLTDMGSGRFASEGWKKAAYHRMIRYINTSNQYVNYASPYFAVTDSDCYSIDFTASSGNWKSYFYFGGPGYNSNCQ